MALVKKKVLIIIPYIPYPPYSGGAVRIFNLIKRISMHCEISLIFPLDKRFNKKADFLRPFCNNVFIVPRVYGRSPIQKILLFFNLRELPRLFKRFKMLLKGVPFSVAEFYQPGVSRKLREILSTEEYDIVQFEYISMSIYLRDIIGFMKNAKSVLVEHDITSVQQKRRLKYASWPKKILYAIDYFSMLSYEKRILSSFDHVISMSELDKKKLMSYGLSKKQISVIKNGADTEEYKDQEISHAKHHIVFLGTMAFIPNRDGLLWFLDNVFPIIVNKVKNATLLVIGEKDPGITRKYTNDHIIFRGIVERLESEMGKGIVFIAPIRIGAGTKLKIVTAMAFGMPVVTTTIGIEGIEASEAKGVIVADTEKSFADAVINLLKDKKKREQLGKNARRFAEQEYSWDVISDELVALYNSI